MDLHAVFLGDCFLVLLLYNQHVLRLWLSSCQALPPSALCIFYTADVIKTRMMNQGKEGKAMYRSSYDCLVKTVRHEGVTALWKGFLPTWARLGPWQFVFWVSYEKLRQASGISSF